MTFNQDQCRCWAEGVFEVLWRMLCLMEARRLSSELSVQPKLCRSRSVIGPDRRPGCAMSS